MVESASGPTGGGALIPAVTHEDGTGRVQTVTRRTNPLFHALLKAVERRTAVPIVVNTSFNIRGEPIVCSPQDAIACFLQTGIDALVLGNYVLTEKPDAELEVERGFARSDALEGAPRTVGTIRNRRVGLLTAAPRVAPSAVRDFYEQLPFTFCSNAVDAARETPQVEPDQGVSPRSRVPEGDAGCRRARRRVRRRVVCQRVRIPLRHAYDWHQRRIQRP